MSELRPTGPVPVELPASSLRQSFAAAVSDNSKVPGMPTNQGEGLLPHVVTFQGIVSSVSRVYRYYDEAMKASLENARYMRNDLMVMEPVEQRRRACALLNWHLEVDDPNNATEKKLAEDLTKILKTIPNFLKLREVLLDAVWYGKSAIQMAYGWKNIRGVTPINGLDQTEVIRRWTPLHGDKIVFRYDDGTREYDPNQVGIRVGAGYTAGDKAIAGRMDSSGHRKVEATDYGLAYFLEPRERRLLAIHKHMVEDGEYEDPQSAGKIHGVGIRSRIYWSWYMKQEIFAYLLEFLERSATGIEIWYYPWGNPDARALVEEAAKERIGNSRNIILMPRPQGEDAQAFGIEVVQPNIAGIDALRTLIDEYFGNQIMRYVLGQTMTNKPQSAGLGSDLPQIQLGSYLQIIRYDAINLGETMTTDVVDTLKLLNYPHLIDIPCRFVIDTESEDVRSKLEAWKEAYEVGVKTKASDWLKMIGASKPEENDEIIQNPVVQQQDRLYQQFLERKQAAEAMGLTPQGEPQPGDVPAQVQGGLGEEEPEGEQPQDEQLPTDEPQPGDGDGGGLEFEDEDDTEDDTDEPQRFSMAASDSDDAGRFDLEQLAKGTQVEMEHTDDPAEARRIAMDHLRERPDYYDVIEKALAETPEPAKYSLREDIAAAAAETELNPTDEQKAAGNYRKGKVTIQGLTIAIENPKGSTRSGVGHDGKPWSIEMQNHYGYIKRHESEADGDHIDIFLGPDPKSEIVFVVNQTKGPAWTHFDEHKVMLGWSNAESAKQAYLDNYSDGWKGFDSIVQMTMPEFRVWLQKGDTSKRAVAKYSQASGGSAGQRLLTPRSMDAPAPPAISPERDKYAKKSAPGQKSLFDEDKHPRGQPDNAGQFVAKGSRGGSSGTSHGEPKQEQSAPGQRDIDGNVTPKPGEKPDWADPVFWKMGQRAVAIGIRNPAAYELKPNSLPWKSWLAGYDAAAPKPKAVEPPPKQRQEAMFHGLNDAPGQQDLFNADKGAAEDENARIVKEHDAKLTAWPKAVKDMRAMRWQEIKQAFDARRKEVRAFLEAAGHSPGSVSKIEGQLSQGQQPESLEFDDSSRLYGILTKAAQSESGKKIALSDRDRADIEKLGQTLDRQVGNETAPHRQAIVADGIIRGESHAVTEALKKRLKEIAPEAWERLYGPNAKRRYSITDQLLARYYNASSDEQVERFWAGDEREIVVIQDGKPMRYSRRHGQVSAQYVTNEAT